MHPVAAAVARCFSDQTPLASGETLVVAFSGGPDSLALLIAAAAEGRERGWSATAVHVDHVLDPGSARRASAAADLAAALAVPFRAVRRPVRELARRGEGVEAAARRVRYGALDEAARSLGARYVATAHHRDDQAETVALRLLFGASWVGLAGIQPHRCRLVRPLLDLPRAALRDFVGASGLVPIDDPGNRDVALARNRLRHLLLPALYAGEPALARLLPWVAAAALAARDALRRRFARDADGAFAGSLAGLPPSLRGALLGLAFAESSGGATSRRALAEFERQLGRGGCPLVDAGGGCRFAGPSGVVERTRPSEPISRFSYTFRAPGAVEVKEIGSRMTLLPASVDSAARARDGQRALLGLAPPQLAALTVRNRRPGDRMRPLGAPGTRRLKEILIDRKLPRTLRDRVPLLCCGEEILWAPGVAIAESCRRREGVELWQAEITPR